VVETPLLVVPTVERLEVDVQRVGVVHVVLGGQGHTGGEDHASVDTLLAQEPQAWFALQVFGADRLGLIALFGIAGAHLLQHLLQGSRPVRHVEAEAGLAVERGDSGAGEDAFGTCGIANRRDRPVEIVLREVARERVARFVTVRVAVGDAVFECHGR